MSIAQIRAGMKRQGGALKGRLCEMKMRCKGESSSGGCGLGWSFTDASVENNRLNIVSELNGFTATSFIS